MKYSNFIKVRHFLIIVLNLFIYVESLAQKHLEDPPLITIEDRKTIKFEQFLFSALNSDSVKNEIDSICCYISVFAKFEVKKGVINDITYSPETPLILKKIVTSYILKTSPFWASIDDTQYLLPLSFNISNSDCANTQMDFINNSGISSRAIMSIQNDKEEYDIKNLLMKKERFKGVILHPVRVLKVGKEESLRK